MRNPEERLRELERAAAAGDERAAIRLQIERTRRGFCARCGEAKELVGARAVEGMQLGLCRACSALEESEALERSTSTYTGYLTPRRLMQQLPDGSRSGSEWYFVTTFQGFPLAIVIVSSVGGAGYGRRRGTGRRGAFSFSWSALDQYGRDWYGRNAGLGLATGMRLRKRDQRTGQETLRRRGSRLVPGVDVLRWAQDDWFAGIPWVPRPEEPDPRDEAALEAREQYEAEEDRRFAREDDAIIEEAASRRGGSNEGLEVVREHNGIFLMDSLTGETWSVSQAASGWSFERL